MKLSLLYLYDFNKPFIFIIEFLFLGLCLSFFIIDEFKLFLDLFLQGFMKGLLYAMTLFSLFLLFLACHLKALWHKPSLSFFKEGEKIFSEKINTYLTPMNTALALSCIVVIDLYKSIFCLAKSLIQKIHPYSFDAFFIALEKKIHFGKLPHQFFYDYLAPNHLNILIEIMAYFYVAWIFYILVFQIYACIYQLCHRRKLVYLYANFILFTIGGFVIATIFSSVGPLFLPDIFRHLSHHYPNFAHILSERETYTGYKTYLAYLFLIQEHQSPQIAALNGITAFPSMHVASSFLIVFLFWHKSLSIKTLTLIFALSILLGSVLLGFHYAVDGYAGILLAYLSFKTAEKCADIHLNKIEVAHITLKDNPQS